MEPVILQQYTQQYTAQEREEIHRAFEKVMLLIQDRVTEEDRRLVHLAYEIGVEAHIKQRRKSGEPYILHPLEVARICADEIGLGPTGVICALLHDVVEDTSVTLDDIREQFGEKGPEIAKIVDGLTKFDNLVNVESPQAENFKKILKTLVEDVRVVLIKMSDRLHNMRTLGSMPQHKQLKIASETDYIYAPLAHRLGLYNIKTEFHDLCMKITDRENYSFVARKLRETKRNRSAYIKKFIAPIQKTFQEQNIPCRIVGRAKSISSIWNKIKTKKVPFEKIYDLFAIRIILDVPKEKEKLACWQVYSIITDSYKPVPERLKDWISTPKANGYESLHTTVAGPGGRFVEVQIRTESMDAVAERGVAAHWRYKGMNSNVGFETWLDGVREILENPDYNAIELLNDFKSNLFSEEVHVFTPDGDMKKLPKGATALDFAFSVHSEVGFHCKAVQIDNKIVPLGYELKNGEQIYVITDKNQKPNEGWLKWVKTGKAKNKIRSSMKEERRKEGELGKEALMRKFRHMKANFDEANLDLLIKHLGIERIDLYYGIAKEGINIVALLKDFAVEGGKLVVVKKEEATQAQSIEQPAYIPDSTGDRKPRLLINGEDAQYLEYSMANNCCSPVQGDDVFAYLTSNHGMKIHRMNCPNAPRMLANYGYRIMKAEWVASYSSSFVADLKITGIDGIGVAQQVTNTITNKLNLNMRSISMNSKQGYFEGNISVVVRNTDQLYFVIQTLQNMDGINSVARNE